MKFTLFAVFLCLTPLHAMLEKDLNLAVLKKAYHWLLKVSEEEKLCGDKPNDKQNLINVDSAWDNYKDVMKHSITLIRKYPKKINDKLSDLFTHDNRDILPLIAFYVYSTERKDKTFRYYDAFNVSVIPANQDNLWVALIPYTDTTGTKQTNYSVLLMDLNNHRLFVKD